jgi:hypothetical protein
VRNLQYYERKLREAAAAWGEGLSAPVRGSRDEGSLQLNRALQRAAVNYVNALTKDSQ